MSTPIRTLTVMLTIALLLPAAPAAAGVTLEPCIDPHPCEVAWPAGLQGPFEAAPVEHVEIVAPDGVVLNGWIRRPVVPAGTKVPILLHSTPYIGWCGYAVDPVCDPTPADDGWWSDTPSYLPSAVSFMIPPIRFVRAGYAVAYFEVRGTGASGGCFDFLGHDEQRDQEAIVDWLGDRPWSNKRVGMGGVSYMAGTSWEAAINAPKALKTIVIAGTMSDFYTFAHSPQGAQWKHSMAELASIYTATSFGPDKHTLVPDGFDPSGAEAWVERLRQRACDDVRESSLLEYLATPFLEATPVDLRPQRNAAFWEERRLIERYDDVRASVLMAHGFNDDGHTWQDDLTSATIRSPYRQIQGYWGHTFPIGATDLPAEWAHAQHPNCAAREVWCQTTFDWLDYWLKGIGERPALGVSYQDDRSVPREPLTLDVPGNGTLDEWHRADSWPPPEAEAQVLYLGGRSLAAAPPTGDRTFVSARSGEFAGMTALGCREEVDTAQPSSAVYLSDPLPQTVSITGQPFAYLSLSSEATSFGHLSVMLLEVNASDPCSAYPQGGRLLAHGTADLRYHSGGYAPKPFPVGERQAMRVDLEDVAGYVEAGHRLAVIVSHGDYSRSDSTGSSVLTVHADGTVNSSQLILPVTAGELGGSPKVAYPPRPWLPKSLS